MNQTAHNVVPLRGSTETSVQQARVAARRENEFEIIVAGAAHAARTAFSCLVQPRPDDLVLASADESGAWFILGIISRPGEQTMDLAFPADATMTAAQGSLNLLSGQSVTVAAAEGLNFISDQAVHQARSAVVKYDEVTAAGDSLQASFGTVRLISRMLNTMARHVVSKALTYVRLTDQADQVKAGQMTRKTDGLYSLDTRQTVMVSKNETKIDGERIFMG